MRGRKPKPTRLKLIQGNPGKRPINEREPKPPGSLPSCPAHLSPTAKTEWKRLARSLNKIGMLTEIDRAAMAAYCQAYGRWVEAERKWKPICWLFGISRPTAHRRWEYGLSVIVWRLSGRRVPTKRARRYVVEGAQGR